MNTYVLILYVHDLQYRLQLHFSNFWNINFFAESAAQKVPYWRTLQTVFFYIIHDILVVSFAKSLSKVLARHHPLKANCLANNRNASDLSSARLPAEKLNALYFIGCYHQQLQRGEPCMCAFWKDKTRPQTYKIP